MRASLCIGLITMRLFISNVHIPRDQIAKKSLSFAVALNLPRNGFYRRLIRYQRWVSTHAAIMLVVVFTNAAIVTGSTTMKMLDVTVDSLERCALK